MSISKHRLEQILRDEHSSMAVPWPHISFKHDIKPLRRQLARLDRLKAKVKTKHIVLAGGVLLAAYAVGFFWPRSVALNYSGQTCVSNPTPLPKLVGARSSASFNIEQKTKLSAFGFPLYSHNACITPTAAPPENSTESLRLAPVGLDFLAKNVKVSTGNRPVANPMFEADLPVSAIHQLNFSLDRPDELFDYRLSAGGSSVVCLTTGAEVECGLRGLKLKQGQAYDFKLERLFDGQPAGSIFEQKIKTVEPVAVKSTSIKSGQLIYSKPTSLEVTFSKPLSRIGDVKLEHVSKDTRQNIELTSELSGSKATFEFKDLPREANFELTINEAEATDQGFLPKPYKLTFKTSGGPRVAGVNIGNYKVPTGADVALTFDVPLDEKQDPAKFVSLTIGGRAVSAAIYLNGRTIVVSPRDYLPRCTTFTVKVASGLTNSHGVGDGNAWQFNSRTICQSIFSIGSSVRGRSITAYKFGTGASKVIYVGGMHGNEKSSTYILNSFIDDLERNAGNIPAHRTIIVIPNSNPDGYAVSSRYNANGVDLNRNFPTNNWQSGVYGPGGSYLPNGGGSEPLSEPESRALTNFVSSQGARLVLTYHAVARVVISNDAGDSWPLAQTYGAKSGYRAVSNAGSDGVFGYTTTGEFEDWLRDKKGIAALLVELATMSGNEFYTHSTAMWTMSNLE